MRRNKYFFGLGTIGRDAVYTLISMYFITFLTESVGLSDVQLAVIGGLMVAFRIFDAVNDPIMGTIVDNTKTRWGKFKPWIVFGSLTSGILTILLFSDVGLEGDAYIVFIAIIYLLWGMAYTTNDLSYWSLMPAISKDQKVREGVGAIARICASVGLFAVVVLYTMVPDLFGLGERKSYFVFAILLVCVMWFFQTFTVLGVKEDRSELKLQERTGLRGMLKALFKNDQLMVSAVAMALFMIGYCTTTNFGVYYFKYAYKDEGVYIVFAAVLAVAQLAALALFPVFSKRFTRRQLYLGSMIAVVVSYVVFFLSFENLAVIIVSGLVLFFAEAFIQLLMLLFLADATEYGEWKLGKRNESVSFAVQPFVNKLGGAIGQGVLVLTLILSGINSHSDRIASIDKDATLTAAEKALLSTEIINSVDSSSIWIMKIGMMILPLICILVGFILYSRKFKIDEKMYETIVSDLEIRNKA
ncbi:MAG: MFS transporter, partial [Clostridia bacterium]|nr:MFS transporter [Clostridia bacterium]